MSGQVIVSAGVIEDLAAELGRRAGGMRSTDVVSPLESVGGALPGSQTAGAASAVGIRMGTALAALAQRVDDAASTARTTAESYATSDSRNAGRLARVS